MGVPSTSRVMWSTVAFCGPSSRTYPMGMELYVPVEDGGLGQAGEAFLDGPGPGLADTFDVVEVLHGGPHDLLRVVEAGHDPVGHDLGEPGDLVEQPVAMRLQRPVEARPLRQVQNRRDLLEVEQLIGGQLGEALHDLVELPVGGGDEVV